MGEVACGETVLGRHLGARDGTPTIISPTLQTEKKKKDSEKSLAQGHLAGK